MPGRPGPGRRRRGAVPRQPDAGAGARLPRHSLWLWLKRRNDAPPLARCHLEQTCAASLWAGALLVIANVAVIALGGFDVGVDLGRRDPVVHLRAFDADPARRVRPGEGDGRQAVRLSDRRAAL
ncbi:MAG: hypothetical protein MZW92_43080 [Comamonadaceae bacterium]|nr:hypothetical protein [Comamonadaceae bacterium]